MVAELHFLHLLLIAAMLIGPLVTSRFFLEPSKLHDILHVIALSLTTAGLLFDLPLLSFAWLLFCLFGFVLFLRRRFALLFSMYELAKCVPFVFSIVAATWLVSGANGFGLLGYGKTFSYYASLHGHFLGWIIVGGIAFLANEADRFNRFYLVAVFVCLASFLLIAFGIDGVAVIKPIGVLGLTVMIAASQVLFLITAKKNSPLAFALGVVSLLGFVLTITLAWQNELGTPSMTALFGTRTMVSLHGVVNGFVVAPCFFLALYFGVLKTMTDPPKRAFRQDHASRVAP